MVDDRLIYAMLTQESGGNPTAISPKGAQGIMQIMPATARDPGYGVTPLQNWDGVNPMTAPVEEQIRFSRDYTAAMEKRFGRTDLAVAAYNAGPGAVQRHGGIPPYEETQNYVRKVSDNYNGGSKVSDWRNRATPVTPQGDWRSRATAIESQTQGDWKSRASVVAPEVSSEKPSVAKDVVLSVASNVAKGGVDAAMILPNLLNEAVAGPQYLYKGITDTFKGNPTDRNFEPWKPFYSSEDVVSDSIIDYKPETKEGQIAAIPARLAGNIAAPSAINKVGNKVFSGERPSAADIKARSQIKYDRVEKSGAALDDQVFQDFMVKAQQIRPQGRIQQATGARDAFDDALEEVSKVSSIRNMTINEVKQLDERLTQLAEGARGQGGVGTPESRLINKLKHTWREIVEDSADKGLVKIVGPGGKLSSDPKIVEDWKSAVKDYALANRVKDVELIIERAKLMDNPATGIKTGFRNLYLKIEQGKARGYTKAQIKAIKHAADTGLTTGIARVMASRLNPIIALSAMGLDAGIVQGLSSKAARDFATKSQVGRGNQVLDLLVGGPTQNPVTAAWAARNQSTARKAATANLATQLMAPSKEKKK